MQKHLGKPYVWGASGRRSFDCSSLMQAVYKDSLGVDIPRVSRDQGDRLGKKYLWEKCVWETSYSWTLLTRGI